MNGQKMFCQEHWRELVPDIKSGDVNGIALQPLSLEAIAAHEDAQEEFDDIIGSHSNDFEEVVAVASPICCWLEGRERYSDGTGFEDDYSILVEMGSEPLDEEPEEWWVEKT